MAITGAIAELPTALEAANASYRMGLGTLMGASSIVRGGSHFGSVVIAEPARHGVLDILSSDYIPG